MPTVLMSAIPAGRAAGERIDTDMVQNTSSAQNSIERESLEQRKRQRRCQPTLLRSQ